MWTQYVENEFKLDDDINTLQRSFSAESQNVNTIYAACVSILYGMGNGFFASGVFAYTGVISNPGVTGKNFGFLF